MVKKHGKAFTGHRRGRRSGPRNEGMKQNTTHSRKEQHRLKLWPHRKVQPRSAPGTRTAASAEPQLPESTIDAAKTPRLAEAHRYYLSNDLGGHSDFIGTSHGDPEDDDGCDRERHQPDPEAILAYYEPGSLHYRGSVCHDVLIELCPMFKLRWFLCLWYASAQCEYSAKVTGAGGREAASRRPVEHGPWLWPTSSTKANGPGPSGAAVTTESV